MLTVEGCFGEGLLLETLVLSVLLHGVLLLGLRLSLRCRTVDLGESLRITQGARGGATRTNALRDKAFYLIKEPVSPHLRHPGVDP